MKNSLETRLGIFVALAVIAAVIIVETVGGIDFFKRGYRIHALFDTVHELKVGDRVKMAGVEVGTVEEIALETNKVMVTMKLETGAPVKTDSTAMVKFTGLMGQNFVAIDFGSLESPRALEGATISTEEQADLSAIMQKLDNVASGVENLTKSFSGDEIGNLLGPFTDFLKQNSGALTATIANMRAVSEDIAGGRGTVGRLIQDDSLYVSALAAMTNIQVAVEDARTMVADARTMLAGVQSGQGSLGKLMHDETLYNETVASMTNLKEILQKINQGDGTIGKLVNDQEFYRNAKLTLQKVEKATEGLEDQGPLSVLGLAVNSLF
jgi:phospholipid/cholesterol/gamma-HCH transport system substrate-binding protein